MRKNNLKLRKEHEGIRNKVGFYDFTHELLEVTGRDARSFLDLMFVNNISSSKVGQGKYTTMLNERGHIIDDVIIFRMEDDMYWVSTLYLEEMLSWFEPYTNGFDIEFKDIKDVTLMYAIQGPNSREVLNDFLAENIDDLKFNWIKDNKINDVPVKVARCGFTGEIGYELYFAPEHIDLIESKLHESGEPFNIKEITTDVVLSSLPTEKGYMLMRDLQGINPIEAGLGWTVDWSKDFVGKEAVQASKENGHARSLVGFTVEEDDAEVELASEIKLGDKLVGKVSNYTYGYTVEKNIGLALIDNTLINVGDQVSIGDQGTEAILTNSVFYDPRDNRRRGI